MKKASLILTIAFFLWSGCDMDFSSFDLDEPNYQKFKGEIVSYSDQHPIPNIILGYESCGLIFSDCFTDISKVAKTDASGHFQFTEDMPILANNYLTLENIDSSYEEVGYVNGIYNSYIKRIYLDASDTSFSTTFKIELIEK